jgi:hypothetical protein
MIDRDLILRIFGVTRPVLGGVLLMMTLAAWGPELTAQDLPEPPAVSAAPPAKRPPLTFFRAARWESRT